MKKFIKSVLLFLPFSILFYLLLLIFWGNVAPNLYKQNLKFRMGAYGHMYTRLQEVKHIKNVDILFLGQSRCYRSFDTRIFEKQGYGCFNLGSKSQTPLQTEVLLNRYLDQLNPKIIIYEVSPITFAIDGVESSLDIIANDKNDKETIGLAFKQNHLYVYNTLIYSWYRDLFGKNTNFKEEVVKDNDTYIKGGFVESKIVPFQKLPSTIQKYPYLPNQMKAFERIISNIKKRNIPLFLVQIPISKSRYQEYDDPMGFDKRMSAYAKYINFNPLMNLQDSIHFLDSDHLNQKGVKAFDEMIIELMFPRK